MRNIFTEGRSSRNGSHQPNIAGPSRESHLLLDNSQSRNVSMLPPVLKSASESGAISRKPSMSEEEFTKAHNSIISHYFEEQIVEVSFSSSFFLNDMYILMKRAKVLQIKQCTLLRSISDSLRDA